MHPDVVIVEQAIVAALPRGEPLHPHALLFLLRLYQATGREDLAELMGRSLALELDQEQNPDQTPSFGASHMSSTFACAASLELLVDTSTLTDDERVSAAIVKRLQHLREAWTSPSVEQATAAIGACLHAANLESHRSLIPGAVDHLEQVVGRAYRPGQGIGAFGDHVRAAAALLTAHSLTGRLPYSMLAEELMLTALGAPGTKTASTGVDFATSCEGVRVLCRLAALHDNLDYRRLAVVAPGADYRRDAARILESCDRLDMTSTLPSTSAIAAAAIYGVARLELDFQVP